MKKTLIALMALAGVAAADTYTAAEANTWLTTAGNTVGGSKYTLTFTIADTFAPGKATGFTIINLATFDNKVWSIYQQDGRYLGLGDGAGPDGSYASRNDASVNSVDTDTAGENGAADYSGWFYDSGSDGTALAGATFSIASGNGYTDITFTTADESRSITLNRSTFLGTVNNNKAGVDLLKFTNAGLQLSSVSITYDGGTLTIPAKPTPSVPEPATATLSLLALAGLAARRRRK